jgi:RNA polymerase sigma-54 factor
MTTSRPSLGQRAALRRSLALTPAMRQSMKLLELSNLELGELLAEALTENPLLEATEDLPERPAVPLRRPSPVARPRAARPLPAGLGRIWRKLERRGGDSGYAGEGEIPAAGPTLHDHLLHQLGTDVADPVDRAIGRALIETVDEAGYLTGDPAEIAERFGQRPDRVAKVLRRLQSFDPPGVCARSLAECLALQLDDRGRLTDRFRVLLENLELLAGGDRRELIRRCGVEGAELSAMVAELSRLDPRPGLVFDRAEATAVAPDLTIERGPGGSWQVALDDRSLPRLVINEGYAAAAGKDAAARSFLSERRQAARWLLDALDRRGKTLLRVADAIVRHQGPFLEGGAAALKPLSRREIAAALGLHESTVGRAAANKYAATPRGVLALTDFFGGRLGKSEEGGRLGEGSGHAPAAVRARLKRLIEAEPPARPLSDDRLGEILRGQGIGISRRTVAKYREMLRIPPSFRRRRKQGLQAGARPPT